RKLMSYQAELRPVEQPRYRSPGLAATRVNRYSAREAIFLHRARTSSDFVTFRPSCSPIGLLQIRASDASGGTIRLRGPRVRVLRGTRGQAKLSGREPYRVDHAGRGAGRRHQLGAGAAPASEAQPRLPSGA